jgi:UPF0755 protein
MRAMLLYEINTLIRNITGRRNVLVLLGCALMVAVLAGCTGDQLSSAYLEANREQLQRPASRDGGEVEFVVAPGTPARAIADQLQAAGLVADARLFEAYVRSTGIAGRLEAGTFLLSPDMTPVEIAEALQNSRPDSIAVTVPEGWRLEQTADALAKGGTLDGEEYRRLATEPGWQPEGDQQLLSFLSLRPADASLEGYLHPDTYQLDLDKATAPELLRRQLETFGERVMPLYAEALRTEKTALSLHEVVTLASIVEREAVLAAEQPTIAGVYLNRLEQGMRLEADPTVQYAMGYQEGTGQWWKTPVYLEEYSGVVSPYNTYLNAGLPPAPIASPGLSSIEAVLSPDEHDYLFFVALPDGSGGHAFSRTFEEHLENVRRYRGG